MSQVESHNKLGEPPCATTAPLWNEGRNHVMFDVSDPARCVRVITDDASINYPSLNTLPFGVQLNRTDSF